MGKSGLGIFFSLVFLCSIAGSASAATGNASGATRAGTKKAVVKKSAAKPVAGKRKPAAAKPSRKRTSFVAHSGSDKIVKQVNVVNGKRQVTYEQVKARPVMRADMPASRTAGDLAGLSHAPDPLDLKSNVALVLDQSNSQVLFEKNSNISLPIASITKLMTGLIVVDSRQNKDEILQITSDDIDREKNSGSRLAVGTQLSRASLLHLALMSSENRAASALGRNYPGGLPAFVSAMNAKARALGMNDTHFVDSSGLSSRNVASAHDLAKLVGAVQKYPILGQYSTVPESVVDAGGRTLQYRNTNQLVRNPSWEIGLQKTGYISEAGRCLVMQTVIEGRSIVMVFLDSKGKLSRIADAGRIRKWIENIKPHATSTAARADLNG
ncbi:D-alanyl-D-alanine endopeptidase [Janthinobacterium sp. 17J80-10]|uniref:D-alanyl-D-alanine endopeptidase n=1 Tax=Janthinobacterium sp. 17J80-10 TaxID=2497863 RepID=UPI0010058EE4|nr:D-alanyl-D-alanine endopeptidase [Janthinobacterium sp. 17J80-10]QAU33926.1 D-alanyl-D-alanine endopeptidase [Janthinobacterium sp. 17J80-10]